jgi:glycosyltransferase involved in cell wall biosynthesis
VAKILFVAFEVPYPLDRGGRIKTFHYLKALSRRHQVTLVALTRTPQCKSKLAYLCSELGLENGYGIEIGLSMVRKAVVATWSLPQPTPFVMSLYASATGKRLVARLLADQDFDLLYADHLHMAQYIPAHTRALTLLDQHNVESVILGRFADSQTHPFLHWMARLEQRKMARYEPAACRRFDAIWVTTEVDRALIAPWLLPGQTIDALPIGVDTTYFTPDGRSPDPHTLVSIGMLSWPPNADGVLWFYDQVYPLIKERVPGVRFVIVGEHPPLAIQQLAQDPSVEVTGWVDDVRLQMARSTAIMVSLRTGSGMRVKILNALAAGLPVVSTSIGCEGIDVTDGKDILIADDAEQFARHVVDLIRDPSLQERLSANGVTLARARYSWEAVYDQIDRSVTELLAARAVHP